MGERIDLWSQFSKMEVKNLDEICQSNHFYTGFYSQPYFITQENVRSKSSLMRKNLENFLLIDKNIYNRANKCIHTHTRGLS